MTSTSSIIRIRVDDSLFTICIQTINKFPKSILYKVIHENEQIDFIHKDGNSLYIDIKVENMKIIVEYLRGYTIYVNCDESVENDFNRLGLDFHTDICSSKRVNELECSNALGKRIIRSKKEKIDL